MCVSAVLSLHKCTVSSFRFSGPLFISQPSDGLLAFLFTACLQTFPHQPQEIALQDVRRCLSAVCQRTPLSSSSWRFSDSVAISPRYAKARKTSATLDLLRSSLWTRLFSCQVIAITPSLSLCEWLKAEYFSVFVSKKHKFNATFTKTMLIQFYWFHGRS